MRYIFLIYSVESPDGPSTSEIAVRGIQEGHRAVIAESAAKGVLRGLDPLKPTSTATTVRMRDGQALITDGPFAETKEQLAGYYIMDCANLDEAIEWAKKIPTGCKGDEGCIEVRPIVEIPKPI